MILNDPSALRRLDTLGSLAATEAYPEQFALGLQLAEKFDLPATYRRDYHEILVLGTGGGSSITGALLTSLFFHRLQQPVIISQGYNIPAFADANTLTVALSHSGNTEEILSAVEQARQRGCPVMAITAGGALGEICRTHGIPHLIVPRDIGHPRRNLGYLVPPLVLALARLGLVPDISADIREAMALMEELRDQYGVDVPLERNPAKQLAARLRGHIPDLRLKRPPPGPGLVLENRSAKTASSGLLQLVPHLHHDEAVGWDMEPELLQKFFLIMLRDDQLDTPKVSKRKEITVEMLRERLGGVEEVWAQGQSVFARLFSLIYLGDFVSLYAATVRGIDPTPVAIINLFKENGPVILALCLNCSWTPAIPCPDSGQEPSTASPPSVTAGGKINLARVARSWAPKSPPWAWWVKGNWTFSAAMAARGAPLPRCPFPAGVASASSIPETPPPKFWNRAGRCRQNTWMPSSAC